MVAKDTIIMGVDPGTTVMGYGIVEAKGSTYNLLSMGVVKLQQEQQHYERLHRIYLKIGQLIRQYQPTILSIEAPFYGKNVQSMLKLGRAQGVAMAAAMAEGLPVYEYAPKKIKQSITGKGNATKEQVADMLAHLVPMDRSPRFLDATDALAAAICHHLQSSHPGGTTKAGKTDWRSFIRNNPDRIG